jgi:hypothetical protein
VAVIATASEEPTVGGSTTIVKDENLKDPAIEDADIANNITDPAPEEAKEVSLTEETILTELTLSGDKLSTTEVVYILHSTVCS